MFGGISGSGKVSGICRDLWKDTDDALLPAECTQLLSNTVQFLSLAGGRNFCRIRPSAFGGLAFPSACYTICSVLQVQM